MSFTRSFAPPDDFPLGIFLKSNSHLPTAEEIEFAFRFENPVQSGRRDLEHIASRDQASSLNQILCIAGHLLAVPQGDSLGAVDHKLDHASTAAMLQGNLDEVQARGLGSRLEGPEKLFPIDVRSPAASEAGAARQNESRREPPAA